MKDYKTLEGHVCKLIKTGKKELEDLKVLDSLGSSSMGNTPQILFNITNNKSRPILLKNI